MADDFETAIYTDCTPGQGLAGTGGMQFQACSPGVGREMLAVIQRHLIYEAPERLIQERCPTSAFPASFGHVYDGIYATAAGVYLGRESGGYRQGNHLTHAIVTVNPDAYRVIRPVQMFGAHFWQTRVAKTKKIEPLKREWQPGPLDADRVSHFVRSTPDGLAMLTSLLSALLAYLETNAGDRPAQRVLFIAEQPELVLKWLTAATLLIPQQDALRIGFKVFTNNPARTTLPVVAVHPDWGRSGATVKDARGYTVFDLSRHQWSEVPESLEAKYWAKIFCEEDPDDVVEAVELASASGIGREAGRELATAAIFGRLPTLPNGPGICQWLRTGPSALREAYGGGLLDSLTALPDIEVVRQADEVAQHEFPARLDSVRLTLLRLELKAALSNSSRARAPFVQRTVSASLKPQATQLVAESLHQAMGLTFDRVLCIAAQFGVSVSLGTVQAAATAFVGYWADHPEAKFDPSLWPAEPPVYNMLRDELSVRTLDRPDVANQWWNQLWGWTPDKADTSSPLDRALLSSAMVNTSSTGRVKIAQAMFGRAGERGDGSGYRVLADVLWSNTEPNSTELRELCSLVPAGTKFSSGIFAGLVARAEANPTTLELEVCAQLAKRRLLTLNPVLADMLAHHRWLQELETSLRAQRVAGDAPEHLQEVPPRLLVAHAEPLTYSLLAVDDPAAVVRMVKTLPPQVVYFFLCAVRDDRHRIRRPGKMAMTFAVHQWATLFWPKPGSEERPSPGYLLCLDIEGIMAGWVGAVPQSELNRVAAHLGSMDEGLEAIWNGATAAPRRSRLLWRSRDLPDR